MKKLLLSTGAAFVFLVVINALLFPVFFPEGPPEVYSNKRPMPLVQYHLLAFLITAFLMSYLYPLVYKGGRHGKKASRLESSWRCLYRYPRTFTCTLSRRCLSWRD